MGTKNADLRPHPFIRTQFQIPAKTGSWAFGPELSLAASWFVTQPQPLLRVGLGPYLGFGPISLRLSFQYQYPTSSIERLEGSPFFGRAWISEAELQYDLGSKAKVAIGIRGIDANDRNLNDLESSDTKLAQKDWLSLSVGLEYKVFSKLQLAAQARFVSAGPALVSSESLAIGIAGDDYATWRLELRTPLSAQAWIGIHYQQRTGINDEISLLYLSPYSFEDHDLQKEKIGLEYQWQF